MASTPPTEEKKSNVKLYALLAMAAVGLAVAFIFREQVQTGMKDFLSWVEGRGIVGAVVLGIAYVVATVAFLPGWPLTVGSGFIYGVVWGTVLVSLASTTGAAAAFLVGRTLARDWVSSKIASRPKFKAIDQALEGQSFKLVFLLRLSPLLPFNLMNYGLGVTRVSFWRYVFGSWLGMLPGTIMYVYLGAGAKAIGEIFAGTGEGGGMKTALYIVGLIATIAVTILITRVAKRAIDQATPEIANAEEKGNNS